MSRRPFALLAVMAAGLLAGGGLPSVARAEKKDNRIPPPPRNTPGPEEQGNLRQGLRGQEALLERLLELEQRRNPDPSGETPDLSRELVEAKENLAKIRAALGEADERAAVAERAYNLRIDQAAEERVVMEQLLAESAARMGEMTRELGGLKGRMQAQEAGRTEPGSHAEDALAGLRRQIGVLEAALVEADVDRSSLRQQNRALREQAGALEAMEKKWSEERRKTENLAGAAERQRALREEIDRIAASLEQGSKPSPAPAGSPTAVSTERDALRAKLAETEQSLAALRAELRQRDLLLRQIRETMGLPTAPAGPASESRPPRDPEPEKPQQD